MSELYQFTVQARFIRVQSLIIARNWTQQMKRKTDFFFSMISIPMYLSFRFTTKYMERFENKFPKKIYWKHFGFIVNGVLPTNIFPRTLRTCRGPADDPVTDGSESTVKLPVLPSLKLNKGINEGRKEGNVLFNYALNTFYLRLYGMREEACCHHMDYSFQLAKVLS